MALLKSLAQGEIGESPLLEERIFSCMLCGACKALCPLGIDVTQAVYNARKDFKNPGKKRRLLSLGVKFGINNQAAVFKILRFLENINLILPVFKIPPLKIIKKMGVTFPESSLRSGMPIFKVSKPRGRVAVFAGCTVNFIYPDMAMSLIKSLNAMGYDVVLPKGEVCCGAPLTALGLKDDAAALADRNTASFKKLSVEAVIGLCPTCVHFIKNEYKGLIGEAIDKAIEASQFFAQAMPAMDEFKGRQKSPSRNSHHHSKVIYHDPCHSLYNLNITAEPRRILRHMGFNLIEPKERGCCGFGGTFRLLYQGMSEDILAKRAEDYKKADMIVTSCPNCILQLRSGIKDKAVKHISEIIYEFTKDKAPQLTLWR
jgi:glycolate oxidase iron-sulfur subunit